MEQTELLLFEPLDRQNIAELVAVLDDPELHEYTGGLPSREEIARRLAGLLVAESDDGAYRRHTWVMRLRPEFGSPGADAAAAGAVIGTVQAVLPVGGPASGPARIGWLIGRSAQGQGHATEAASRLIEHLRGSGWTVTAAIHPGNAASQRVARRLGLRPTGEIQDDEQLWETTP